MDDTISQMLDNHQAESWRDLSDGTDFEFDNERLSPLERVEEYVDYCFDTYPIVYNTLDRDILQVCVADWGRRRGQARYNERYDQQVFGRQVREKHKRHAHGRHCIFMASALVGVPPEDDNGTGWKPTVRHELGHVIDYVKRGRSGHDAAFKAIMDEFGEERNDGMSQHGYPPRFHR